ncbi:hypothetical protein DFP72DRAFT_589395 [Ephemerocybe angulata]|uniref:Uncharacterized protein n=1 Tax=Ephemerocybe angulata TaxID=980116 RepID=A0A8H6HJP2_9AGAR|nr:hypothetical protein DFP72DRAFT_589395 [Tulosesus angulatus]
MQEVESDRHSPVPSFKSHAHSFFSALSVHPLLHLSKLLPGMGSSSSSSSVTMSRMVSGRARPVTRTQHGQPPLTCASRRHRPQRWEAFFGVELVVQNGVLENFRFHSLYADSQLLTNDDADYRTKTTFAQTCHRGCAQRIQTCVVCARNPECGERREDWWCAWRAGRTLWRGWMVMGAHVCIVGRGIYLGIESRWGEGLGLDRR